MEIHQDPSVRVTRRQEVEGYQAAVAMAYGVKMQMEWSGDDHLDWSVRNQVSGALSFSDVRNSGTIRAKVGGRANGTANRRIILMLVEEGALELDQSDGQHRLRHAVGAPGTLLMLNCGRSLEIIQPGRIRGLSLGLPTDFLAAQYKNIESCCGIGVSTEIGMASILRDMLRSLWREQGRLQPDEQKTIPAIVSNLIGSVFVRGGQESPDRPVSDACMARIHDVIETELHNGQLGPRLIAERLHVSPSYLYAMARRCGTSIGDLIMDRRLERCRDVLADPARAAQSVTEIAFAWGFQDLSHFSRRFSSRFGCSPKAFRRSVHGALQQDQLEGAWSLGQVSVYS